MKLSIIILAAGASSRMQQPKMLLSYKGKTLIQRAVETALEVCNDLIVVTGAETESIHRLINQEEARIVHNQHWQQGMGGSIQKGVEEVLRHNNSDGIIIMVCDQPFISIALLKQIKETFLSLEKGIVACSYKDTIGTPVLFSKKYFDNLLKLKGPEGAKKLLIQFAEDVAVVHFPEGAVDIDTPGDYDRLLNSPEQ